MEHGSGRNRRSARAARPVDVGYSRERDESRRLALRRRVERFIEVRREQRRRLHRHRGV